MNLVIDSGNSAAKVGIFDHQNLVDKLSFASHDNLRAFVRGTDCENVIVSSVRGDADEILSWAENSERKFVLSKTLPLPINNLYATPETLGMDRLAGVCGARQ
ncbi:MAG TPA: type III pantothenate kinase, partial [Chryseosolibacter sp.]|nr:type III pantothenate kinase [Chryseosolibacter sp.]